MPVEGQPEKEKRGQGTQAADKCNLYLLIINKIVSRPRGGIPTEAILPDGYKSDNSAYLDILFFC
jgi:hypothetical protein